MDTRFGPAEAGRLTAGTARVLSRGLSLGLGWALALGLPQPAGAAPGDPPAGPTASSLLDLSLEELANVIVSSASRREQPLSEVAASLYVITGDEIRRAGATTLPEALRLAPNLLVGAIDARQYAISARGFNSNIANKLLVMVDGRTIYSPLFSGVFWDAQDFVPADIDRIEVISGPAGATWGTNAVNGVINVVTLPASKTPGPSLSATAGTLEKTVVGRFGGRPSDELAVRGHVRSFRRDSSRLASGTEAGDASSGTFAGLRADWARGDDAVSLDAGTYRSGTDSRPTAGPVELAGTHVKGQWTRRQGAGSEVQLQAYLDRSERTDRFLLQEQADILDAEARFLHTRGRHRWLAGLGYRRAKERSEPGLLFAFFPAEQQLEWISVFAQDEFRAADDLALTAGLRLERNGYSGWEALPSARLGWTLPGGGLAWAALSRAVRSPSRFDREIFAPPAPPFVIAGGPDFDSELADVGELGYRAQLGPGASFSATAFIQDYDRLRSGELAGSSFVFANGIEGEVRGIEAWGSWQPQPAWRLDAGLLWLDKNLRLKPGSTDPTGPSNLGNDPRTQWSLRSIHRLGDRADLALAVRHADRLPSPEIPAYTATDLTLNWTAGEGLRVALGVRDAFNNGHAEYQGFSSISEIPRSAFITLTYQPS
jgi:iron complex outermembrane receptor protein